MSDHQEFESNSQIETPQVKNPGLEFEILRDIFNLSEIFGDIFNFFAAVFFLCFQIVFVLGAVLPYIPQYFKFKKTKSTDGFSSFTCLALLLAHTLRVLYWFGVYYETPLLLQSILMNFAMLALVNVVVHINAKDQLVQSKERLFTEVDSDIDSEKKSDSDGNEASNPLPDHFFKSPYDDMHIFFDFDPEYFWRWTDFQSYVEFVMTFAACGSLLMFLFVNFDPFVQTVGFLAVFIEAMLGVPQFYRNFQNKSTYGMSIPMVLMWMSGDIFKTTYFILREAPTQFWVCGSLQICVDVAILSQVWLYRENTLKKQKSGSNLKIRS